MLKMGIFDKCKFIHNNKELFPEMTLTQSGLENMTRILVISKQNVHGAGFAKWYYKLINIKFIKISKCINTNTNILNLELIDLLKLCLLKEISSKFNFLSFDDKRDKLEKELPDLIFYILQILQNGYVTTNQNIKKTITEVIQKEGGDNIINFSKFVDKVVDRSKTYCSNNEIIKSR